MKKLTAFLLAISVYGLIAAQEQKSYKFKSVEPADFKTTVYSIDSNANAVVIADIGSTEIIGNRKGWFSLEFKRKRRVHILNKNGYDIANIEIPLYTNGSGEEEVLSSLKAVTYNLEAGKVVETKLDKSQVFKDKISKKWMVKKFTFPNIKEGSIIEFEYVVTSDFIQNLQPWEFQEMAPVLWSEYNVAMPQFLDYVMISQGYQSFYIKDQKDQVSNFVVTSDGGTGASDRFSFTANVTRSRWVMKDVPALKSERFTSTLKNHVAKMDFQLAGYRYPLTPQPVMGTWTQLTTNLLKAEYFGAELDKDKGWMSDMVSAATSGASSELEKAKTIFAYVKNNFTCTSSAGLYLTQPLKAVSKAKNGNVADVNLMLVALLKTANITASPVILSTRSHGYTYDMYPLIDKFNYVIAQVVIDNKTYYLDASHPRLGFGMLTDDCYNYHARVVNEYATPVELSPDSLKETKVTTAFIIESKKGTFDGKITQQAGLNESYVFRERIKEKGEDEFFKDIRKAYNYDIKLQNPKLEALQQLENNLGISYEFNFDHSSTDLIYFNPMMGEGYKENYFKSAERAYPVEMPFTIDETYVLQLQVPEGYEVDELPKSIKLALNENQDGFFEYLITSSNGQISMRSRITIKRTYFIPDEYEMLREFFNIVVKKHSEQIVFKKKKA